jgi:cyanophycinase-like exopeptidase
MAGQDGTGEARAAGVLTVIGSGETGPTVAPVYRRLRERAGTVSPALLLDTSYAFQANAAEITAKLRRYFRGQLGVEPGVVARDELADRTQAGSAAARIYGANWVFAGPGSPSYAMRWWRDGPVQAAMAGVLRRGGCVVFASAAACTLGVSTLPVYEIYKAGADPYWLDGLDLMALAGLRVTVVPHFDNGEGGRTHDTSRCFIGERRLRLLEGRLPDGTGVLGVDEYTAAVFDLAADTLSVLGRGGVTLRRGPVERRWESGQEVGLGELREPGEGGDRGRAPPSAAAGGGSPDGGLARLDDVSAAFERALADGDVQAMVAAIMGASRLAATPGPGGEAQLALGGMVARLGELAVEGLRDPAELLAPLVGPLLRLRTELRQAGRYELADTVRGVLTGAGVEVRDTPDGTDWRLDSGVESASSRRSTDSDRPRSGPVG